MELKVLEMEGGGRERQMEDGETRWDQKKKKMELPHVVWRSRKYLEVS